MSFIQTLPRVLSGIQPTGIPHLGNYFGAIQQWSRIVKEKSLLLDGKQTDCDVPIFSIVNVHACDLSQPASTHLNNILSTTASLIALGIDPEKCILFKQSDLRDINLLRDVLDRCVSLGRLSRMTQYKDKSRGKESTHMGLLNYPVLQAADILIFKATHVPVGEDQLQHLELTRDIARKFNHMQGFEFFPLPSATLSDSAHAYRIKSLREPEKKMSKSDSNKMSTIGIFDEPDVIVEKCKKALTDTTSEVYYDTETRPGVSNLMRIYHLSTGYTFEKIESEFKGKKTAEFKLQLADVLIAKFNDARREFNKLMSDQSYLKTVHRNGLSKAQSIAANVMKQVENLLGWD